MKLVLLGAPGAGKGTLASYLVEKMGVPTISTGNMLRAAIADGTELGKQAKSYMDAGDLVPDSLILGLIKERLAQPDCKNGCILDGFPRTVPQAEALAQFARIDAVIDIEVSDEKLTERLSGRRVCLNCGGTYHVSTLGGRTTCEKCGSELIQRNDDKAETVLSRLSVYHAQTAPLIDYYAKLGLIRTIDGAQPMEACFEAILCALGEK